MHTLPQTDYETGEIDLDHFNIPTEGDVTTDD